MGDETIAQVNKLEYEKDPNGIKGHYLDTGLEIAEYDSHINKLLSEEEFRQFTFSPDEHMSNTINRTEVTYRSEEHTSELQSRGHLVCRLLLEKKKIIQQK